MNFGEKIKLLRYDRELTQDDLGYLLNVTKSCISCYENGSRQPSLDILIQLATFFGVSVDFLIGLEEYDGAIGRKVKLTNKDFFLLKELKKEPEVYKKIMDNISNSVLEIKKIFRDY